MAKEKQKIKSIIEEGPQGYRELQELNNEGFEKGSDFESYLNTVKAQNAPVSLFDASRHAEQSVASNLSNSNTPWGESMFDEDTATINEFENLGDIRANNQPWYSQLGAGIAKGAVLAGTTFLDGTIGLIAGAAEAISRGGASGLWDNDFSRAMKNINDSAGELMPNYYTRDEIENPWSNIFSANFVGDKFIKNLGFSIGALYSGGVVSAGLKATKLPQLIGKIAQSSKAPAMINTGVGAAISAVNEGRVEALNNSETWYQEHNRNIDNLHMAKLNEIEQTYGGTKYYDALIAKENEDYSDAKTKLNEDRLKMGNVDLMLNIPILMASNIIQFGKLYANGFKTARHTTGIGGTRGKYFTNKSTMKGISKGLLNPLSEGTEEISQGAAAKIAGNYYTTDMTNFINSKMNPDAEKETLDWVKSFATGINETVNDGSAWEEFFIGALTGALGIPGFKMSKAGSKFPISLTINGGFYNEVKDYNKEMKREEAMVNTMNQAVQNPEFINYYRGLIRDTKYQNDMNKAAEEGDAFDFKNAEFAQLLSMASTFDNAGKSEDLKANLDLAFDTSDENLNSIIKNTTKEVDGKLVGPFAKYASKDSEGNIEPNLVNEDSKKEMIEQLTKNKKKIDDAIDTYLKAKDEIDNFTGQQLNDDQLEELAWLKSQIGNWQNRASQLSKEVKPAVQSIMGTMAQLADYYHDKKVEEGQNSASVNDVYRDYETKENNLRASLKVLDSVVHTDDLRLAYYLFDNPESALAIKKDLKGAFSEYTEDEASEIGRKIDDMMRLAEATTRFKTKLKEYLSNPETITKDVNKSIEQIAKQEIEKKSVTLKESLTSAKTLREFRQALNDEPNDAVKDNTLQELENEDNPMVKAYKEVSSYNSDVQRAIDESAESPQSKQDALLLLQDQFEASSSLEEVANPNSIYVNNDRRLQDDSVTPEDNTRRFQEAQYTLLKAMNKVNSDNKFKGRFTSTYVRDIKDIKKEVKEVKGTNPGTPDTTGDSGTPTVPAVNAAKKPVTTEDDTPPAGGASEAQVSNENKELANMTETQISYDTKNGESRKYYRPSIPEFHIEASKEGDFRSFKEVAKEREGKDFIIFDFLEKKGAFDYVNSGKLKVGDEIGFMISSEYEEMAKGKPWHTQPTIFMTDKKSGQIVGSLDESPYSVAKFVGLKALEDKIIGEYNSADKSKDFTASPVTKVSKMMIGKVPYSTDSRNLANVPNVDPKTSVFAIVKNGVLTTNGKLSDSQIIKPMDLSNKEGRLYLLIPNAAGKYSPVAVRVKHFNKTEFNPEDVEVQNSRVYNNIKEAVTEMANAKSEEDLNAAIAKLKKFLYLGNKDSKAIHINWFTSSKGSGISFIKVAKDANGNEIYDIVEGQKKRREEVKTVYFSTKTDDNDLFVITGDGADGIKAVEPEEKDIATLEKEITDILLDYNLPIQINIGSLNTTGYNIQFINSGVLTSNISDARVKSSWFTTDYFDDKGNSASAENPQQATPATPANNSPVGGNEGVLNGIKITIGSSNTVYGVDLSNRVIYDKNNNRVRVSAYTAKLLFDLAWAESTYGSATEGANMWHNKVITPNGEILDRGTKAYLADKAADEVKGRIAGNPYNKGDEVNYTFNGITYTGIVDSIRENSVILKRGSIIEEVQLDLVFKASKDSAPHTFKTGDRVSYTSGREFVSGTIQSIEGKYAVVKKDDGGTVRYLPEYLTLIESAPIQPQSGLEEGEIILPNGWKRQKGAYSVKEGFIESITKEYIQDTLSPILFPKSDKKMKADSQAYDYIERVVNTVVSYLNEEITIDEFIKTVSPWTPKADFNEEFNNALKGSMPFINNNSSSQDNTNKFSIDEVSTNKIPSGIEGKDYINLPINMGKNSPQYNEYYTIFNNRIYKWLLKENAEEWEWFDITSTHPELIDKVKNKLNKTNQETTNQLVSLPDLSGYGYESTELEKLLAYSQDNDREQMSEFKAQIILDLIDIINTKFKSIEEFLSSDWAKGTIQLGYGKKNAISRISLYKAFVEQGYIIPSNQDKKNNIPLSKALIPNTTEKLTNKEIYDKLKNKKEGYEVRKLTTTYNEETGKGTLFEQKKGSKTEDVYELKFDDDTVVIKPPKSGFEIVAPSIEDMGISEADFKLDAENPENKLLNIFKIDVGKTGYIVITTSEGKDITGESARKIFNYLFPNLDNTVELNYVYENGEYRREDLSKQETSNQANIQSLQDQLTKDLEEVEKFKGKVEEASKLIKDKEEELSTAKKEVKKLSDEIQVVHKEIADNENVRDTQERKALIEIHSKRNELRKIIGKKPLEFISKNPETSKSLYKNADDDLTQELFDAKEYAVSIEKSNPKDYKKIIELSKELNKIHDSYVTEATDKYSELSKKLDSLENKLDAAKKNEFTISLERGTAIQDLDTYKSELGNAEYARDETKKLIERANHQASKQSIDTTLQDQKVQPKEANEPIFEANLSTGVQEDLSEFNKLDNSKEGYYIDKDGKVHKTYLTEMGEVNGIKLHMAKVPHLTKGFGKDKEHSAFNDFLVVFPNGKSLVMIPGDQNTRTQEQARQAILKSIQGNPQRVVKESSEETVITKAVPLIEAPIAIPEETPQVPQVVDATQKKSGAEIAAEAESTVNNINSKYEDDDDLGLLRAKDSNKRLIWNQTKELAWLRKVLPQLSDSDRLKIVKGLIKVGKQGVVAWGQFNKGIITLSDIAAEGTTYHEAFHAVFHLLLNENERQALFEDARKTYGNKSNLDLEEDMAEGFREYVMSRETRSLGRKIIDFFKELFAKVTNWNQLQPSLISYYRMIDRGEFAKREINLSNNIKDIEIQNIQNNKVKSLAELRKDEPKKEEVSTWKSLEKDMQKALSDKGWTREKYEAISEREKEQAKRCVFL